MTWHEPIPYKLRVNPHRRQIIKTTKLTKQKQKNNIQIIKKTDQVLQ